VYQNCNNMRVSGAKLGLAIMLICHLAHYAWGGATPCTYKSSAGDFYDLSPLALCEYVLCFLFAVCQICHYKV